MKKRRIEMDILRGIAIIGVLLIHISSTGIDYSLKGSFSEGFSIFINQISRTAVPVFLLLSGLGLAISKKIKMNYFAFLNKRISKVIVLYFLWNIIYYFSTEWQSLNFIEFFISFFIGSSFYHLYYVPLIIVFYVLYPIMEKMAGNIYGLILAVLITVFSQLSDGVFGLEILNDPRNFFNWLIFFVFGIWLAKDFDKKLMYLKRYKTTLIVLLVGTIIGVFAESYFFIGEVGKSLATTSMRPSIILFTLIFTSVVLLWTWKSNLISKIFLSLADMSYGIYLSHALIFAAFTKVYASLGFSLGSVMFIMVSFIVVLPVSIVVSILIDKIIERTKNFYLSFRLSKRLN